MNTPSLAPKPEVVPSEERITSLERVMLAQAQHAADLRRQEFELSAAIFNNLTKLAHRGLDIVERVESASRR